jgi:hypothetical protein
MSEHCSWGDALRLLSIVSAEEQQPRLSKVQLCFRGLIDVTPTLSAPLAGIIDVLKYVCDSLMMGHTSCQGSGSNILSLNQYLLGNGLLCGFFLPCVDSFCF